MVEVSKDMAIKRRHVKAVIQFRRATEQEWINRDPVLRLGEPALSTDVYQIKIGDGVTKWSLLPYLTGGGEGGTTDYLALSNLPSINGTKLKGNLSTQQLGLDYSAGNGINIENKEISLDELVINCGTSTTVL